MVINIMKIKSMKERWSEGWVDYFRCPRQGWLFEEVFDRALSTVVEGDGWRSVDVYSKQREQQVCS